MLPHWKIVSLLVVLAMAVSSEVRADPQDGNEYFEKHIRTLFAKHCYQCHSKRAKEVEGGLLLDSRGGWLEGGESGLSVVAGNVDGSKLIQAVRYTDPSLQMPPIKPLHADEISHLEEWIRMGAPGPTDVDVTNLHDPSDPVAGKDHWAFKPISERRTFRLKTSTWATSPVDQFILDRLDKSNLYPVGDANPRELLRRVHFLLTGLPPSSDEIQNFLDDHERDALERVVDQLLASPQFGERWGRHWLDLARYADSNGLDENFLFREAWRYRNWVIAGVNEDVHFDRFVREQIAGDLLPFDSMEQRDRQRIAAGFLVIGPKVLLGNNENNQRMEVADEQIDTIGRAILGQTLGCARCHDHKFDPIPTSDYYAMAGIFASTSVMETRHMLGSQRAMERLEGLGPGGAIEDDAYERYWRELPELKNKKKLAESALVALKKMGDDGTSEPLAESRAGLAEAAQDATRKLSDRITAQGAFLAELSKAVDTPPKIPPRAMIPIDAKSPCDEHIRLAGQFDRLGSLVPRGALKVLQDDQPITIAVGESGRTSLAHWLTEERGRAGQLVARVQANRIWHHLLGFGLVRTVDNFGRTGEQPSHPELLDFLAQSLIDSNWSVKALIRQIVLSRTFSLSSQFDETNFAVDPDNRLLWRANRRRLDPESFRDALLTAAGQLDLRPMESSVSYLGDQATAVGANKVRRRTDFPCRSVYLPVIRNDLPELFQIFDFADPQSTTGSRPKTTVPTQGLFILNDSLVMDAAEATARRIMADIPSKDSDVRVDRMFEWILNTVATKAETDSLNDFLRMTHERLSAVESNGVSKDPEFRALAIACHALFASSRFQFLE